MSEANDLRGEVTVALEGVDYVMRPSYEAQVTVERQTGRSIRELAKSAGDDTLPIAQAAVIVTEFIKAQGKAMIANGDQDGKAMVGFNAARVGELLVEEGMLQVASRLELVLFLAATGGYTAQGERKATGKTAE